MHLWLSLQYNYYKHNKTRTVSNTFWISVTGQVQLLHRECLICTCGWICRRRYSAQVGLEGSSGDCAGTLRHWLIPFLAGLHWPMGGTEKEMLCTSDLSTRKSIYSKNFKKEKWNMTLDVLDEKVCLQLFSQSAMGHVTSPLSSSCHLLQSGIFWTRNSCMTTNWGWSVRVGCLSLNYQNHQTSRVLQILGIEFHFFYLWIFLLFFST